MFISAENAQRIVDEIKATIQKDLNIMDDTGVIIASTDSARVGTLHKGAQKLLRSGLDTLIISDDNPQEGTRKGINLPIRSQDKYVGVIGITGDPESVSSLGSVIQKMTEIMIVTIQQQAALSLQEHSRFNFIEYWLFSEVLDEKSMQMQADLLEIDLNIPRIVALFESPAFLRQEHPGEMQSILTTKHLQRGLLSAQDIYVPVNNRVLILFAEKDIEVVRKKAQAICSDFHSFWGIHICCGISQVTTDFRQLRKRYKEALNACHTAATFGSRHVSIYNESSLYYITQAIPPQLMEELSKSVFQNCTEAEKYELLETLKSYFLHNGNTAAAAESIFLHPNSYLYRLKKVTAKTKLDPRNPHDGALLSLLTVQYILSKKPD